MEVKKSHAVKQHVPTREESLAVHASKEAKLAIETCASVVPVAMSTRKAQ